LSPSQIISRSPMIGSGSLEVTSMSSAKFSAPAGALNTSLGFLLLSRLGSLAATGVPTNIGLGKSIPTSFHLLLSVSCAVATKIGIISADATMNGFFIFLYFKDFIRLIANILKSKTNSFGKNSNYCNLFKLRILQA